LARVFALFGLPLPFAELYLQSASYLKQKP
jgi:hypothetical protein